MATLQDIADAVGISKAAVSRILNHKGSFSAETITRVEDVARRLNYATPAMLQEEQQGDKVISIIVPPTVSPYFGTLVAYAEKAAARYGYGMLLQTSVFDRDRIDQSIADLKRKRFAGILLGTYADYFDLITSSSLPIVTVGYKLPDNTPSVRSDGIGSGKIAARHLLGRGCTNFAYLTGNPRGAKDDERYQGFAEVLAQQGIEPVVCENDWSSRVRGSAAELITRMALDHPQVNGIFAESQSLTAACLRVYSDLGYQVPQDVRVVGYGTSHITAYCNPVPSIVCENTEAMASKAVELLVDLIENGNESTQEREVVVPVTLQVNQTS